jgi:hypothetical protein
MTTPIETPPAKAPSAELQRLLVLADPLQGHPSEQAAAAATRALGLARAEACFVPHGAQAATWLCAQLFRQGLFQQVQVQARAVLDELQAPAMLEWRCEILRLAAMASCEAGDLKAAFDTARALDEAASASGNDSWMLMAGYTLGACLDRIGDPWHASRVMKQAMDSHGAKAAPRQRLIGQIGLCAFSGDAFHRLRDAAPAVELPVQPPAEPDFPYRVVVKFKDGLGVRAVGGRLVDAAGGGGARSSGADASGSEKKTRAPDGLMVAGKQHAPARLPELDPTIEFVQLLQLRRHCRH